MGRGLRWWGGRGRRHGQAPEWGPLVGARLKGVARAASLVGRRRAGTGMALLLCLVCLTAALAHGCLHCHSNFSKKFSFYRHHVNFKSWWVGDIPVSGALLTDWSDDTMKELHLAIPAKITREKLDQVATAVYQMMDQLYQGKMYFPGYFPNELRNIFREQVHLIQNAIIESRIDCQHRCGKQGSVQAEGRAGGSSGPWRLRGALAALVRVSGIFQYETISCNNCTDSHVACFGYNCESSAQWKSAVQGLLNYINNWHNLVSPALRCLEPPHLANLTLEDAAECLKQH
eukprot:XP_024307112.1 izumo sperm-egg fusion protein 4 isoform X3 [Homo sapiens]